MFSDGHSIMSMQNVIRSFGRLSLQNSSTNHLNSRWGIFPVELFNNLNEFYDFVEYFTEPSSTQVPAASAILTATLFPSLNCPAAGTSDGCRWRNQSMSMVIPLNPFDSHPLGEEAQMVWSNAGRISQMHVLDSLCAVSVLCPVQHTIRYSSSLQFHNHALLAPCY